MAEQIERRKHPRNQIKWAVNFFSDRGVIEGEAVNISVEGLSVRCDEPIRLEETYRMSILPADHPLIEITGKIIWSEFYGLDDENKTCGMGVCFVEIADEDRRFLEELESKEKNE